MLMQTLQCRLRVPFPSLLLDQLWVTRNLSLRIARLIASQWPQYVGFLQFHLTNARVMVPEQPVGTRAWWSHILGRCPSALGVAVNISGGSGLLPLATIGRHGLPAPSHPGCMHPMHADVTGCQHAQPLHLVGRRSMRSFYAHLYNWECIPNRNWPRTYIVTYNHTQLGYKMLITHLLTVCNTCNQNMPGPAQFQCQMATMQDESHHDIGQGATLETLKPRNCASQVRSYDGKKERRGDTCKFQLFRVSFHISLLFINGIAVYMCKMGISTPYYCTPSHFLGARIWAHWPNFHVRFLGSLILS